MTQPAGGWGFFHDKSKRRTRRKLPGEAIREVSSGNFAPLQELRRKRCASRLRFASTENGVTFKGADVICSSHHLMRLSIVAQRISGIE
jgi:hypothetical protein